MALSFRRPLSCLLRTLPLTIIFAYGASAQNWTVRNPRLIGPQLNAVAATAARCVAVGYDGRIVTSTNGANWVAQNLGANRHLMDVIYANRRFAAVGALYTDAGVHSLALTSADGVTWTERPTASRAWKSVAYGNGLFVAVGDHTIDTSPDAITWTRRTPQSYVQFSGIAYGGSRFVAIGVWTDGRGNSYYSVQRSTDGITWSGSTAPTNAPLRGIAYGNGQFLMVGEHGLIFSSPDGSAWTRRTALAAGGNTLNDVLFWSGTFFAVGNAGIVIRSTDGVTWFSASDSEAVDLYGAGSGFGRMIAVGERCSIVTSTNQQTWTSPVAATYSDLRGVTYAQQKWVAVGTEGAGVTSTDGTQWSSSPVYESPGGASSTWFNAVAFGGGKFLTVGGQGFPNFTSADAVTWTGGHMNLGVDDFFGVAHANGRFVAVGIMGTGSGPRGGIRTSESGTNWVPRLSGVGAPLRCVAHGNGVWVAGGSDVFSSSDGASWTVRSLPVQGTLRSAVFGAGRFVMAGDFGGVITSTDGRTWTFHSAFGDAQIYGLAFGGGQFVGVGERDGQGVLWTSGDGIRWREGAVAPYPLKGVRYGNLSFTAVGDHGLILQSSAGSGHLGITRQTDGSTQIACSSEPGRSYRLQASSDGRTWTDLMSFVGSGDDMPYNDRSASTQFKFYRLVSP